MKKKPQTKETAADRYERMVQQREAKKSIDLVRDLKFIADNLRFTQGMLREAIDEAQRLMVKD